MNDVVHDNDSRTTPRRPCPDGANPPLETLGLAKSLLSAYHAEQSAKRQRQRAADVRLQDRARHLALGHLRTDAAGLRHLEHEHRELVEERLRGIERAEDRIHRRHADTARDIVSGGSGLALATPPYDFDWVSGGEGIERADRTTGTYNLRTQSLGRGWRSVAAGVGFWFHSGAGNPAQRFSALLDYTDVWFNSALFYVSDVNVRTRLWVFGAAERDWVVRSEQSPSWSDHANWLDSHGNDPEGSEGRVVNETFFNAAPDSWYQCWIWSEAQAYGDSGAFGFGAASIGLNVTARFAVLGSL